MVASDVLQRATESWEITQPSGIARDIFRTTTARRSVHYRAPLRRWPMPYPATKLRPTMPTMLMAAAVAISGVSTTSAPGKYVSAASGWYANQPKEAVAVGAVAMNMITPPSVSTPKLIAAMVALDDSRCMTERYRSLNGPFASGTRTQIEARTLSTSYSQGNQRSNPAPQLRR